MRFEAVTRLVADLLTCTHDAPAPMRSSRTTRRMGRPIRFANDANRFALSEATDGAAAGRSIVFGVIVGTGTGGGMVIDGRVVTGVNAIAGE